MNPLAEMRSLRGRYQDSPLVHKQRQYLRAWVWWWAMLDPEQQPALADDLRRWAGDDAADALYWAMPWYTEAHRLCNLACAADALCLAFVFFYGQRDPKGPPRVVNPWAAVIEVLTVGRVGKVLFMQNKTWIVSLVQGKPAHYTPPLLGDNAALRPAGGNWWHKRQGTRGHAARWTCMALCQLTRRPPTKAPDVGPPAPCRARRLAVYGAG